jgi:hypothetical protein
MSSNEAKLPPVDGAQITGLFVGIAVAAVEAKRAREAFKERTDSPAAILGETGIEGSATLPERVHNTWIIGRLATEKARTEILSKQLKEENTAILRGLLTPEEGPAPILRITALSDLSIARSHVSEKKVPGEKMTTITGTVSHIGEFSVGLKGEDGEAYNFYPTKFTTGEPDVVIEVVAPLLPEAKSAPVVHPVLKTA